MKRRIMTYATCLVVASLLSLAGCATSPEDERRHLDMEADIDDILTYELDAAEYGEAKNCLNTYEYRSFRPLGNRHLLFEGRNDKQWVNVLRGRCAGLNKDSKFIMRQNMSNRFCDKDRFDIADYVDPYTLSGKGPTCVLGEFKPVTSAQVEEIENRLEMR
jgi:hypothetical protein